MSTAKTGPSAGLAALLAALTFLALPAGVLGGGGYGQDPGYSQQGGGYWQQGDSPRGGYHQQGGGYYPPPGRWKRPRPDPYDGAGHARLGRTMGGAAGIAAGSMAGAALATAVIKSAGVAALGPLAPILIGTAITAAGAWIGAKGLSMVGQEGDRLLGPDMTWAIVGGIAGSVLGFTLLPSLGPFAGPMGRIIGAALGGFVGGTLGKIFAPTLDRVATPPVIYGATGALLGGVGFGPVGALAGAAGGYALGRVMDRGFFIDPHTRPRDVSRDIRNEFAGVTDRFRDYRETLGDWVHGRANRFRDRLSSRWGYYDYPSDYYTDYSDSRRYAYELGYGQGGDSSGWGGWAGEVAPDLKTARDRYYQALQEFQRVSAHGSPAERASSVHRVHETQQEYLRLKYYYGAR